MSIVRYLWHPPKSTSPLQHFIYHLINVEEGINWATRFIDQYAKVKLGGKYQFMGKGPVEFMKWCRGFWGMPLVVDDTRPLTKGAGETHY